MLIYLAMPVSSFEHAYSSAKVWTLDSLAYFTASIMAFLVFSILGSKVIFSVQWKKDFKRENTDQVLNCPKWLRVALNVALFISIFAYVYWFFLGISRSGSLVNLFSTYLRDPFYVKEVILQTSPGITTLTQLAVAAIPLSLAFKATKSRFNLLLILLVIFMALFRSIIFSERLALIELIVPSAFVLFEKHMVSFFRFMTITASAILIVFTFFSAAELRRSFVYSSDQPLLENAVIRFVGYYVTSINNGQILYEKYRNAKPLSTSLQNLWKFPIQIVNYAQIFPQSRDFPNDWLSRNGLNAEFNTGTLFGELAVDFGYLGILVAGILGYLSGLFYQLSLTRGFWSSVYGIWLVGLSESMRIYYFANARLFPAFILFAVVLVLGSFKKHRVVGA
jgi:oligosaccharide repeat unit polymerase